MPGDGGIGIPTQEIAAARARPASGPAAPMSSNARRVGMTDRIRMTAPIVPKGERIGSGMKKGSDASTLWMRAAM